MFNALRENGTNLSAIDYNGCNILRIVESAEHVDAVKCMLT